MKRQSKCVPEPEPVPNSTSTQRRIRVQELWRTTLRIRRSPHVERATNTLNDWVTPQIGSLATVREVDPCVFTGTWTLLQKEKEEGGELKEFLYGSPPSLDKRKKQKEKEDVTAKESDSVTAKKQKEKEYVTAKEKTA